MKNTNHAVESNAIYIGIVTGIIGFVVGLGIFNGKQIPVYAGTHASLALVASLLGAIVALVIYFFASFTFNASTLKKPSTWFLSLTHSLLTFTFLALVFYIIGHSFKGVVLDPIASAIILTITTSLVGYFNYLSAYKIDTLRISILLAIFLVTGVFISMLTSQDPNWWHYNFSALGAGRGISGNIFNLTLIMAGMIAVSLASFLALDLLSLKKGGYLSPLTRATTIRLVLAAIGVALAFVGIFVVDKYPVLHVASATGMTVIFGLLIIALPWMMPGYSKAFFVISYILLAALIGAAWLFLGVGYFNLTALEMVAFAIIFTWLVLFVRQIAAMLADENK